jgi:multiple sugar transport system permease protein
MTEVTQQEALRPASPVKRGMLAARATTGRPKRRPSDRIAYLLVAPLIVLIVGLVLIPALYTLGESFFTVNDLDPPTRFSGLSNFRQLLENSIARMATVNSAAYVVIGVTLATILGILFAVLLQRKFRGRSVVIALLILPWALPGVIEGIIWEGIYDPNVGLLNSVLSSLHLINHYHVWLGQDRFLTIALIELVQVWQITPLSALLVLTALQVIPDELYEAALLDGCSWWSIFRRITLPLARGGVAIAMAQAVIATLNGFDIPYVLNGAAPTAAPLTMETYLFSFQNLNFGQGYALSLFITVVTISVSFIVVKITYRQVEY